MSRTPKATTPTTTGQHDASAAAARHHPARRDLFGFGAAMLLLVAPAAGAAKAEELDGRLIAAAAAFQAAEDRLAWIDAHPLGLPCGHPENTAQEAEVAELCGVWDDAVHEAAEVEPRTPEGLRLKGRIACAAVKRDRDGCVQSRSTDAQLRALARAVAGRA